MEHPRDAGWDLLLAWFRGEVTNDYEAKQAANVLAPYAALAGIYLAPHLASVEVRRLLARKSDDPHGALRLQPSHQSCRFDQHGDGRRVVVGAGCTPHRIVMSADDDGFFCAAAAWQLGHKVGNFLATRQIRLPRHFISRARKFAFNVRRGRRQRLGLPQMTRADQPSQAIDVAGQRVNEFWVRFSSHVLAPKQLAP